MPKPASNTFPAPPRNVATVNTNVPEPVKPSKSEVNQDHDPYELKVVKKEPVKPAAIPGDQVSDEEMDFNDEADISLLSDNSDEEHDVVSDTNLSNIQVVEEFPEVKEEKTERILEKMGTESAPAEMGMFELCDDIVMLLNPGVTSTPQASPARRRGSTSASTHSSMPPLESLSSSSASDSGNSNSVEIPAYIAATAEDTVKVISNEKSLFNHNFLTNQSRSRNPTSLASFPFSHDFI